MPSRWRSKSGCERSRTVVDEDEPVGRGVEGGHSGCHGLLAAPATGHDGHDLGRQPPARREDVGARGGDVEAERAAIEILADVERGAAAAERIDHQLARLRELEGSVTARRAGRGTEFDALRSYVPGDDATAVDWRATARMGRPIVRDWVEEYLLRVAVVLDTHVPAALPKRVNSRAALLKMASLI